MERNKNKDKKSEKIKSIADAMSSGFPQNLSNIKSNKEKSLKIQENQTLINQVKENFELQNREKINNYKQLITSSYAIEIYPKIRNLVSITGDSELLVTITQILDSAKHQFVGGKRDVLHTYNDFNHVLKLDQSKLNQMPEIEQVTYLDLLSKETQDCFNIIELQLNALYDIEDFIPDGTHTEFIKIIKKIEQTYFDLQNHLNEIQTELSDRQEAYSLYSMGKPKRIRSIVNFLQQTFVHKSFSKKNNQYTNSSNQIIESSTPYQQSIIEELEGTEPKIQELSVELKKLTKDEKKAKRNYTPQTEGEWMAKSQLQLKINENGDNSEIGIAQKLSTMPEVVMVLNAPKWSNADTAEKIDSLILQKGDTAINIPDLDKKKIVDLITKIALSTYSKSLNATSFTKGQIEKPTKYEEFKKKKYIEENIKLRIEQKTGEPYTEKELKTLKLNLTVQYAKEHSNKSEGFSLPLSLEPAKQISIFESGQAVPLTSSDSQDAINYVTNKFDTIQLNNLLRKYKISVNGIQSKHRINLNTQEKMTHGDYAAKNIGVLADQYYDDHELFTINQDEAYKMMLGLNSVNIYNIPVDNSRRLHVYDPFTSSPETNDLNNQLEQIIKIEQSIEEVNEESTTPKESNNNLDIEDNETLINLLKGDLKFSQFKTIDTIATSGMFATIAGINQNNEYYKLPLLQSSKPVIESLKKVLKSSKKIVQVEGVFQIIDN
jgi:hypothetical protein